MRLGLFAVLMMLIGAPFLHAQGIGPIGPGIPGVSMVTADPAGACATGSALQYNTVNGKLWGCQAGTWTLISGGTGGTCSTLGGDVTGSCAASTVVKVNGASVPTSQNVVGTNSSGQIVAATITVTRTVASGSTALATSAIASGACDTTATGITATGVATTDNIMADFNADPTGTTGYAPSSNGMLTIIKYPTSNAVNFKVCNNTSSSITPGAITLNWRVVR